MAELRLYLDEDSLARSLSSGLRERGFDILTATEAGMLTRSDPDQFAFAVSEGRILYTANVADFARIHADCLSRGGSHPGIIVRTWQLMPVGMQLSAMVRLRASMTDSDLRDRMIYLARLRS